MRILILGGTGAIGMSLVEILVNQGHEVYVTSRRKQVHTVGNLHYLCGDAHNDLFLDGVLQKIYDAIVDFMVYSPNEFRYRMQKMLNSTKQYIFLSSSRVYADSNEPLTEESPRLLDICTDEAYLKTNEYALVKAREEDLLIESTCSNWTIIRPYITYNLERLQLGVAEKEAWLWRAMHGRTIVFPRELAECKTTLTYGDDVANVMSMLIGNPNAMREIFNIASSQSIRWKDVLNIYCRVLEQETGRCPEIYLLNDSVDLIKTMNNEYQFKYDRLYHRRFDCTKIHKICVEPIDFLPVEEGLTYCLRTFIAHPRWQNINCSLEVWEDLLLGEYTLLNELPGTKDKLKYWGYRYVPTFVQTLKKVLHYSEMISI